MVMVWQELEDIEPIDPELTEEEIEELLEEDPEK